MVACDGASGEPWLLVALGTSETSGSGAARDGSDSAAAAYPGQYAEMLCQQLGISIEVHSYFPINGLAPLSWWEAQLASDGALRTDLGKARIVTLWALESHDIVPAFYFGECSGAWPDPLKSCIEQTVADIPKTSDAVYGAIADLVADGALVMAADAFLPPAVTDRWGDEPFWPELLAILDPGPRIAAVAAAHGITLVRTSVALNGPSRLDPIDPALIQGDGLHLTHAGQTVVAEAFAAADGFGGS